MWQKRLIEARSIKITDIDRNTEELLAKFLSGEASDQERKLVRQWIDASDENHAEFSRLRNIWEVSHPAFAPETIDTNAARAKVLSVIKFNQRKGFFYYWQRVAAILVLPVLLFAAYVTTKYYGTQSEEFITYNEVTIPSGTRSKLVLPDSSVVWLNSGSTLKYPVKFASTAREVTLHGEAYFEVKSHKRNPFNVLTSKLTVTATGTAFNVEAYDNEDIVAVTLAEGIVDVSMSNSQQINIHPNQRFVYNNITNRYSIIDTDALKWCAWKDGMMMFRDDNLKYIFGRLSQIYNVDLQIKDSEIGTHLYRATFKEESLDEILNLIKLSAPIKYKDKGRNVGQNNEHSKRVIEIYKNN